MISTVLLVTVGGSHEPIVTTIGALQPDRVIFICSDGARGSQSQIVGEGTPCEVRKGSEVTNRLPNIPTQTKLGDRFEPARDLILLQDPDDLAECYGKISSALQTLQQSCPGAIFKADYTGGTKSMSVGLAMVSIDYQVELFLTSGNRTDLIRVQRGEMTTKTSIAPVLIQRTIDRFLPMVLQQYNYPAAIGELTELVRSMDVPKDLLPKIRSLSNLCKGLDAWDRFDHLEAIAFLLPYANLKQIQPLVMSLKRVIYSRSAIDADFQFAANEGILGHGYEIVQDLLLNAQRRAVQHRYDDAVGRLYRALELLVQVRLWKTYELKTGDLDIFKLPEALRPSYQTKHDKGKVTIALCDSYELLVKLNNDPLGQLYKQQRSYLLEALKLRNRSLFAHGFQPIDRANYQHMSDTIGGFIAAGIALAIEPKFKAISPLQFPTSLNIAD